MSCCFLLTCALLQVLNRSIRKAFTPPDLLQDTRRNFKSLLLGGTNAYLIYDYALESTGLECISFARLSASLDGDFEVLRHMHSYLEPGGRVVLALDMFELMLSRDQKEFNYADLSLFHPVTHAAVGVKFNGRRRRYPVLFYPTFSFKYLWSHLYFRVFAKPYPFFLHWSTAGNDNAFVEQVLHRLESIKTFCMDRQLRLKVIVFYTSNIDYNRKLDGLKKELDANFDVGFASNSEELLSEVM